jgi:hypothetical protein
MQHHWAGACCDTHRRGAPLLPPLPTPPALQVAAMQTIGIAHQDIKIENVMVGPLPVQWGR